ncbi:MAG: hypothetical protein V1728_05645, partial [Candidatus Micrarchaeota archaeon]
TQTMSLKNVGAGALTIKTVEISASPDISGPASVSPGKVLQVWDSTGTTIITGTRCGGASGTAGARYILYVRITYTLEGTDFKFIGSKPLTGTCTG